MIKYLLFYSAIAINSIGLLVAIYFLIKDLTNQYGRKNNALLLATVLMSGWIALCFYLHHTRSSTMGTTLAWIPATPLLLYGLFLLVFMVIKPDMK